MLSLIWLHVGPQWFIFGPTGLCCVSMVCVESCSFELGFTGLCVRWVSLVSVWLHWSVFGLAGLCWVSLVLVWVPLICVGYHLSPCWISTVSVLGFTDLCWISLICIMSHWSLLELTSLCWIWLSLCWVSMIFVVSHWPVFRLKVLYVGSYWFLYLIYCFVLGLNGLCVGSQGSVRYSTCRRLSRKVSGKMLFFKSILINREDREASGFMTNP